MIAKVRKGWKPESSSDSQQQEGDKDNACTVLYVQQLSIKWLQCMSLISTWKEYIFSNNKSFSDEMRCLFFVSTSCHLISCIAWRCTLVVVSRRFHQTSSMSRIDLLLVRRTFLGRINAVYPSTSPAVPYSCHRKRRRSDMQERHWVRSPFSSSRTCSVLFPRKEIVAEGLLFLCQLLGNSLI